MVVAGGGGGSICLNFSSRRSGKVRDTSFPYLESNSHPPLYDELTGLACPLYRSAGQDRQ